MFITDAVLTKAVKDVIVRPVDEALIPQWETTITRANREAYGIIVRSLAKRGYTKTQIDQWDDGAEFQESIGLWRVLTTLRAMIPDTYSQEALNQLDRRMELAGDAAKGIEPVPVMIDGEMVAPASTLGQVTFGEFDTTQDPFGRLNENDTRNGAVIKT